MAAEKTNNTGVKIGIAALILLLLFRSKKKSTSTVQTTASTAPTVLTSTAPKETPIANQPIQQPVLVNTVKPIVLLQPQELVDTIYTLFKDDAPLISTNQEKANYIFEQLKNRSTDEFIKILNLFGWRQYNKLKNNITPFADVTYFKWTNLIGWLSGELNTAQFHELALKYKFNLAGQDLWEQPATGQFQLGANNYIYFI